MCNGAGRSIKQRLLRLEPAICRLLVCAGASAAYDEHAKPVIQAVLMSSQLSLASTPSQSSDAQREHAATRSPVRQQANSPQVDLRRNEQELARTYAGDREPASVAYPVPDKWYTAEEVDVRAEPLTPVNLVYPEQSAHRIRGRVRIALFIDERGWVRKAQVLASEPERLFDDAAIRAWQEVRFSPALKDDLPVKSEKLLEMDFTPY
jgi:TonB family protein